MSALHLGEVSERVRRATVRIETPDGRASGSGVIWSAGGSVVTNAHVVAPGAVMVTLWDGRRFEAREVSRDDRRDVASLRVQGGDLPAAYFRDSATVAPGEVVVAVGNPLGFTGALSTGVVHAVGPMHGLGRRVWVQAAVRLAPGNSGGPLADAEGSVIGINTMVANGLGLAVPSNALAAFMEGNAPPAPLLGVTVRPVALRSRRAGFGLLILEVGRGSLAEFAALKAGDLLVALNGRPFESLDDLGDALETAKAPLKLDFLREPGSQVRQTTVPVRAV